MTLQLLSLPAPAMLATLTSPSSAHCAVPSQPDSRALALPVPDRQTLYREVWSVPRIHLRARYGLTDHEFRKLCQSLRIPLPRAGHWSRVAAGQCIVPTPLPR